MPKILISYRRADSSAIAGRIADRLSHHYGDDSVFMDVDSIPIGIDFRTHIHETLQQTDVLIAVIGPNWLGQEAGGAARMNEKTDAVRVEVETALQRKMRVIPVLVDGARMPASSALPPEFGDFAFLNAAEVATGRDFRSHMDRLIAAIDHSMAGATRGAATRAPSGRASPAAAETAAPAQQPWLNDGIRYFIVPLIVLLVAHDLIVNKFDLRTEYLWASCITVPFLSGFALLWVSRRGSGAAFVFALALGIIGVVAMTISESLNSGDPIMPQTRFEWWDNIDFAIAIALSFIVGHVAARALRAVLNGKAAKP
jgi:hypothetical protein